jgi:patatin-like phospholipase/acyl hydrolase
MANRNNTVYVLSIDGGGMRGYLSLRWLKRFVQLWGIPQTDIYKYFDVICGTSIGGILALALSLGFTLDELVMMVNGFLQLEAR